MRNSKRIVFDGIIYQRQAHGGASRIYNEIIPRICDIDNAVNVEIITEGPVKQKLPYHEHITPRPVPSLESNIVPGRLSKYLGTAITRTVKRFIINHGKDTIWHSTYYSLLPRWKGPKVTTVLDMIHERYPEEKKSPRHLAAMMNKKASIQTSDIVICISKTTLEDVKDCYGIDTDKLRYIHLAPSPVFRPLENGKAVHGISGSFMLYIGGRTGYKNFSGLLKAYAQWPGRNEVSLLIIGEPFLPYEISLLEQLDITGNVHRIPPVNDEQLCTCYNSARAFIYPSLYEGFGIPLLEAMACKCPVIASRIPTSVEIAGDIPFYFDPYDKDDLGGMFDEVLNKQDLEERTEKGRHISLLYSWDKTARGYLNVYRELWNNA